MSAATAPTRQQILLLDWIRRAVDEVDLSNLVNDGSSSTSPSQWPEIIRNSMALCSDDYLISTLRVARLLADQICEAESVAVVDRGEENGDHESNNQLPSLPPPGTSWADRVHVYLSSENRGDVNKLHFNIENAEITPTAEKGRLEDGMQRIYSLGIVFYQIFSGGEHPPNLEHPKGGGEENPESSHRSSEELSQGLLENLEPLPFDQDQGGTIDLAGALSILDDVQEEYNLLDDDVRGEGENLLNPPNPKKRHTTQDGCFNNMCSVSVEPLKAKCLPRAMCDLVANMLDCANGTISKDDTYRKMSDVRDDLQIMLDKPSIYLYDQDMGRLSTIGLQIGVTVFGRHAELSTIKDAYRRSVSGESELVTISGPAGTGKSFLAWEFGNYALSSGGILLSGKFDQLQQGKPFSALASAFDVYCGCLLQTTFQNSGPSSIAEVIASELRSSLGREAYYLAKIIPNLAIILGHEPPSINNDEDCFNAPKRLEYLLCQFVEVISTSFDAPVTLFLDDLQWADPASISAVNRLLFTSGQNRRFFFLGCYREGEIDEGHPTWKLLSHATTLGVCCTNVKLDCMDEETLNTMVSETLCLFPRLTWSLSSIMYRKTKGNPLFVSRLLLSLSKEGLLRPSLIRRRWEWDKEKIQCQKLPDDVATFVTNSIRVLPKDVKSSLRILSCFGASGDSAFIKTLERALHMNLLDNLDIAVSEGLMDKTDDQYSFSHDRIQEAAYNMMDFLDRCNYHFNYGMALARLASGEEGESILLTAVTQLNLAGPEAVQDSSQNAVVANLNLRAGKKAMEMSDFGAAYSYFDYGISFLRKKHWDEHYDLSLELFDSAAKCALTNGDTVSLQLLSEQVLAYGRSFEDKLNVMYFVTCSLAYSSKLPEAIEKGLDILSKLGIDLRGCGSRGMEACVQETKDLLSVYTDDEILNTRRMTDPTKIMAMKFLGKLELGMTQMMPKSVPYVTRQIIQLSLHHGMSPVSPIGFVHFGSYIAKLGDIRGGYHYVKLALSLLDKVGSRQSAGEVICFGTEVRVYVEPLQSTLEYHNEGYAAAMASGDVMQAAVNNMISCTHFFFAGVTLQIVREKCAEGIKFMEDRKLVIFMLQLQYFLHSVVKLIGTDEEPKYVSAEEQKILATNTSVMTTYYYQKTYISFTFRSYDNTKHYAEKYLACVSNTWANLLLAHAFHAFYIGLSSFWLARKSRDGEQWYERGNKSKLALKKWAKSSQWTFENKWHLLEAEDAYCNNDFEAAKTCYAKAISSAKDHKFVHEEALASELAAYFYLEAGDTEKAMQHFLLAHKKYLEWGALGKCDSLFKFVESNFTLASADVGVGVGNTDTTGNSNTQLEDIENAQWNRYILECRRRRDSSHRNKNL